MRREERRCKGCGRTIIFEAAAKRMSHAWPQCAWFTRMLREHAAPVRSFISSENQRGEIEELAPVNLDGSPLAKA